MKENDLERFSNIFFYQDLVFFGGRCPVAD